MPSVIMSVPSGPGTLELPWLASASPAQTTSPDHVPEGLCLFLVPARVRPWHLGGQSWKTIGPDE